MLRFGRSKKSVLRREGPGAERFLNKGTFNEGEQI